MKTVKTKCQKCDFMTDDSEKWVEHFKEKHPEVKQIRIGKEVINLEG